MPSVRLCPPSPPLLETPNNTSLHIEAANNATGESKGEEEAKGAADGETVKQYLARPRHTSNLTLTHSLPRALTAFLATHALVRRG